MKKTKYVFGKLKKILLYKIALGGSEKKLRANLYFFVVPLGGQTAQGKHPWLVKTIFWNINTMTSAVSIL